MSSENVKVLLVKRPVGPITDDVFKITKEPIERPGANQILVKVLYLSLDPAMRGWMTEVKSYVPPVGLGEVMRGYCVAKVIESNHETFVKGDFVLGTFGWQQYAVSDGNGVKKIPKVGAPPTAYLGVLGATGLTAYFGLLRIGDPKPGETVVISGAAGATGSVAGQIAKIKGCTVVGIAGGAEKCKWLVEACGFDIAVDYKSASFNKDLRAALPKGVDVYFDNVGGHITDAVLANLNERARVVMCGAISQYNGATAEGLRNYPILISRRAKMEGFIVIDYMKEFPQAVGELAKWYEAGKIKSAEQIIEGIESAPTGIKLLFGDKAPGKLIVRVGDETPLPAAI